MTKYMKDPDAVLDFLWDWSTWLTAGDTIASHAVLLAEGDVAIDSSSHTTTTVTAWLSAGTAETDSSVTARVTTAQGRTDDRTITIYVRQR